MIERQLFRAISTYRIYGLRSVFFAAFFPPLLPFRIIWGNIINFTATVRSINAYYFSATTKKAQQTDKKNEPMKWDKTEHTFLSKEILRHHHRRLGDVLIEKALVQPKQIVDALTDIKKNNPTQSLGRYLLNKGWIEEYPLIQAVAEIKQSIAIKHIDLDVVNTTEIIQQFDENELLRLNVLPLIETQERMLFATIDDVSQIELDAFAKKHPKQINFIYTTKSALEGAFHNLKSNQTKPNSGLIKALEQGILLDEQILIAMNRAHIDAISLEAAFELMGIYGLKGKVLIQADR